MADEQEDHPDSSGKEVRLNSHFFTSCIEIRVELFRDFCCRMIVLALGRENVFFTRNVSAHSIPFVPKDAIKFGRWNLFSFFS